MTSTWKYLVLGLLSFLAVQETSSAQFRSSRGSTVEVLDSPGWYEHQLNIQCTQDEMLITVMPSYSGVSFIDNDIMANSDPGFSGSIYPRGLGRAKDCIQRYRRSSAPVLYRLPLRACNTMPYTLDDGTIEYRNILMVQPHPRLVTGRGKSHQVSCTPTSQTGRKVPQVSAFMDAQPGDKFDVSTLNSDKVPIYSMKIFRGDPKNKEVATNVKIGDPLTLVISLDKDLAKNGMMITDCIVKDGLGWAQQNLIDVDGCPVDNEIMGNFDYSNDGTSASVTFQAHKFPYTASVYYQCSVELCTQDEKCVTLCDPNSKPRTRRQADEDGAPAKIEVFSGLYVNEASDLPPDTDYVTKEKPEDAICISQRNFTIAICVVGLILMLAVVIALLVILTRRRSPKSGSNTGSSIYSGPYTNTGYSHTS